PATGAAICLRRAIGFMGPVEAAEDILRFRPLDVVGDEQVQMAVAIVIEPQRGGAESIVSAQMASFGDIGKAAVSVVLKQPALSYSRNKKVREAIVVEIADGHAHPVHFDIETRAAGDVGECAVAIVAVEDH